MPCSDGNDQTEYEERNKRFRDVMARLSCDRCSELIHRGGELPEWAMEWWKDHIRKDDDRRVADAWAREEQDIRKRAIAKLTPEERAELGV